MLKILIIADIQRGERVLESICRRETDPIYIKTRRNVQTEGGTTYAVIRREAQNLMGYRADQIILDFAFVNSLKTEIAAILSDSCVPERFRIIDDRDVLN